MHRVWLMLVAGVPGHGRRANQAVWYSPRGARQCRIRCGDLSRCTHNGSREPARSRRARRCVQVAGGPLGPHDLCAALSFTTTALRFRRR